MCDACAEEKCVHYFGRCPACDGQTEEAKGEEVDIEWERMIASRLETLKKVPASMVEEHARLRKLLALRGRKNHHVFEFGAII